MLTETHCIVTARARTGGPSSAGSITHTSASTPSASPANQSPNTIHPARAASSTSFFIDFSQVLLCGRARGRRGGEDVPPATPEFRRRAVVVRSRSDAQAVDARLLAHTTVGQ